MDVRSLTRDAARVHAALEELPDGRLVTSRPTKIIVPARFEERGLTEVGVETHIVGIYAMVVDDLYYGVSLVNAMIRIEPFSTMKIKINGIDHYEFTFRPGDTVFSSTTLVKSDVLVYRIYDEIISKGRVPWYLGYSELGRIFDTARYHAGANIGANREVTELIISMIARNKKDRTKYYRTAVNSLEEMKTNPPAFVPLRSVIYAATNTTNKLAGSHFSDGIVSALVSPADRPERLETLLRT